MIALLKRLFSKPSVEDLLKEFGGEEIPYASVPKQNPGEAKVEEGEQLIFSGRPISRTFGCYRKTVHRKLKRKQADELQILIVRKGEDYLWKSRGSCPLKYALVGRFHYFTVDDRGAFIKIVEKGGAFHYVEGFTYSMISFLLWGKGEVLHIKPVDLRNSSA
jgi:hypothetical protein